MKNIRDIRSEKCLYFVMPKEALTGNKPCCKQVAVIIFLYYMDSVEKYSSYMDNIPEDAHVYIVSSNRNLYEPIVEYIKKNNNRKIGLVEQVNRGRDISALLVACREICLKYKYICFVHDKKRKEKVLKEDFDLWIDNIWGNSIGSKKYIFNVLNALEANEKIGLLVPPEPIGKYMGAWYANSWGKNFELVNQLVKELDLRCNLTLDKAPITLGTVFWAKSVALKKLFDKNWRYEDFDEEPLKNDGTISHAIERIFGYVAQDAGYDTGIIMNTSYAEKMLCISQEYLTGMYFMVKETYDVYHFWELLRRKDLICKFCKKNSHVYLYGAGRVGKGCLHLLRTNGYEPKGYIVSDRNNDMSIVENVPVKTIDEIDNADEIGIIITVGAKLQEEIENNLKLRGITNYIKYID